MKRFMPVVLSLMLILAVMFAVPEFMRHERRQSSEIIKLRNEVRVLTAKMDEVQLLMARMQDNSEGELFRKTCENYALMGGINYLAVGNSITLHKICDYWWSECGMAASETSKDYFHLVTDELKKHNENVNSFAYGSAVWEILTHDRSEAIALIDPYLNEYINLITIQLGENVLDLSTFEDDYAYLLAHIKQKCPNAQIISVSDFWQNGERDNMKTRAAEKSSVRIADISAIKDNPDYMCGIDSKVKGEDGEIHLVKHAGVARHPGDKGMKYIADKIIERIDFTELNANKRKEQMNHE